MRYVVPTLLLTICSILSARAEDGAVPPIPPQRSYPTPTVPVEELMGPSLADSDLMTNEPVLFIKNGSAGAKGELLFEPEEIVSVRSSSLDVTYESGKDYGWDKGTRTLILPEGSRIASREPESFYPEPNAAEAIEAAKGAHQGKWLRYGESRAMYCDDQVVVTYRHKADAKVLGALRSSAVLEGAIERLKGGGPFKVVLLGDSISEGASASATINKVPYMPPYGLLVVDGLKRAYGREVEFVNLSKGGETSAYGVGMIPAIVEERPDLLIVAFGMNDATLGVSPDQYGDAIAKIIEETQKRVPQVKCVVVATTLANPDWTGSNPEMYEAYLKRLKALKKPNIALSNMTEVWEELLKKKSFWDLTANGVNHPNDFGHRLYAQAILHSLVKEAK